MSTRIATRAAVRKPALEAMRRKHPPRAGAAAPPPADLTARLRALYEETSVPVAEIARLARLTERTIYKYARRFRWRPRVLRASRGLRSLDPAGAALAAAQARARLAGSQSAQDIVAAARARDDARRAAKGALADARMLDMLYGALTDLAAMQAARARVSGQRETALDRIAERLAGLALRLIDRIAADGPGPARAPGVCSPA